MVVVVQLAERQIVALEVKGSIPFDHPRYFDQPTSSNGVSPSGKALDSDSNIRRFESCHPSQVFYGSLAQSVEHLTFNQGVPGPNPG